MSTSYSCANRVADPSNPKATCQSWCGNSLTCIVSPPESLQSLIVQYGNASHRHDVDATSALYKLIVARLAAPSTPAAAAPEDKP